MKDQIQTHSIIGQQMNRITPKIETKLTKLTKPIWNYRHNSTMGAQIRRNCTKLRNCGEKKCGNENAPLNVPERLAESEIQIRRWRRSGFSVAIFFPTSGINHNLFLFLIIIPGKIIWSLFFEIFYQPFFFFTFFFLYSIEEDWIEWFSFFYFVSNYVLWILIFVWLLNILLQIDSSIFTILFF